MTTSRNGERHIGNAALRDRADGWPPQGRNPLAAPAFRPLRRAAWRKGQPPKFMDWAMTANPFVAARRLPTTA